MERTEEILKKYWGYSRFLPLQQEIIKSVLAGNDTLAIMATGGGKSLCYQLPALCLCGLTVVISPLIALMKDQVDDLNRRGISAAAWTSFLDYRERARIEEGMKNGTLRLLFISPEKCLQANFLESLRECTIRLIAIDEAHCISEWGHNFRPEYRQLSQIRKIFPDVPLVALTATAMPEVRRDIMQQLGLIRPKEYVGSFNRTNLHYCVIEKKNPLVFLRHYIGQHRTDAGIVYCMSRIETEEIAAELKKRGFKAVAYHAGLSKQVRDSVQDAFLRDEVQVVCATVAFGMGIDKSDVRYIIHYDLPKTIESYYQETGRAGRDGRYSECILLYSRGDLGRVRSILQHDGGNTNHIRHTMKKLQDMAEFCETTSCRRRHLLRYFGEAYPQDNCGSCDICDHPPDMVDGTEVARLIVRCVQQLPARFGIDLISDVLRSSKSIKISDYGLDKLPAYGTGKKYSKIQYRTWINELLRQGYLTRIGDQYPVIGMSEKGGELLKGHFMVKLPVPDTRSSGNAGNHVWKETNGKEEAIYLRLKDLRKRMADKSGVMPYIIFADKSLREMAALRPGDREAFAAISGVGPFKLAKYGSVFIEEILKA
jgi:ATP-dependent DNA helicase RecQ